MRSLSARVRKLIISYALTFGAMVLMSVGLPQSRAAGGETRKPQEAGGPLRQSPASQTRAPQDQESQPATPPPQEPQAELPPYDKAIFQPPIPSDQLAFLKSFDGAKSGNVINNKQYRKLIHSVIPDCMFHYGSDMSIPDALDLVIKGSPQPVQIRDGRYMLVSGRNGPYLAGRGFMWIDLQDGIALGGFYFHPTNGEPTPTVNIFSKQVKVPSIEMSQLPGLCRGFGAMVSGVQPSDCHDALFHHRFQHKDFVGTRRRLLRTHGRDERARRLRAGECGHLRL